MTKHIRRTIIILTMGSLGVINMCSTSSIQTQEVKVDEQIASLIEAGDFSAATKKMEQRLSGNDLTEAKRKFYLFEIERLDRVRKDFPTSRDEVLSTIKKYYPQVSDADMERWEQEKSLETKTIDGQKLYFEWAGRNLFRIDPAMRQVWAELHPDAEISSGSGAKLDLDVHNQQVIDAAQSTGKIYVEPKRIRIKQSLKVKPNRVPAGELLKCWIPYPRLISGRQEDIKFIQSLPETHILAPEDALQRTIYLESTAVADEATLFSVEYELSTHGVFHNIDAEKVTELNASAELKNYLGEAPPHIVFTPELRALSEKIVGDEKNPYIKAQLIFAWIDENTPWASAREYSTIPCIPQYALENGHGDCGIQTLLFMTLCRINNIPTRWQSGWELQPPDDSMHDWGLIYFEPYGWVPMDVTYGLRNSDDPKLHWFYLGGMDSYRIIFNDDYGQSFTPEKEHHRSETVDSQRGEVEWSGGNLYFDQWNWNFEWEVLE